MSDTYPCGHYRGGDNDQWFQNGKRQSRRCRQCNVADVNARTRAGREAVETLRSIKHPLDDASLVEVLDYAARRLADASYAACEPREFRLAIDRFDEAYMWAVAALSTPIKKATPDA